MISKIYRNIWLVAHRATVCIVSSSNIYGMYGKPKLPLNNRNAMRQIDRTVQQVKASLSYPNLRYRCTFGRPMRDSCTSCRRSWNSWHHFLTICTLMTSLSCACEFQQYSYFLPLKTVSLHKVHTQTRTRSVAPCSLYYSPHSFGWSDQL